MQDDFEIILRAYHKKQGKYANGFQKEIAEITHRSKEQVSNYIRDPSKMRTGDLQAICLAWSINLEDTGRLVRCCEG